MGVVGMWTQELVLSSPKDVTGSSDRLDEPGRAVVVVELFSQMRDMHIYRTVPHQSVGASGVFEQRDPRDDPSRTFHEDVEQVELEPR